MNLRSLATLARRSKNQLKVNRIRTGDAASMLQSYASFSTDEKKKDPLRDAVNRLKGDKEADYESSSTSTQQNEILSKVADSWASFSVSLSETWDDLINSNTPRDINKKLHESRPGSSADDDNDAADKYEGSTAIMIIDEDENLTAFERIQRRLSDAPIIQNILNSGEEIFEKSGARGAKEKLEDVKDDAKEAWETSQNPWVYRVSSVYDTMTAESESAMTERQLRDLDPDFSLALWKEDLVEVSLPKIMELFLEGRIKELKPLLGEAVYNRLAAESKARKKEGVYVDTNVLGINHAEILKCSPDHVNKGSPLVAVHFMVQQINCVRKKKDDTVVEGAEDDIRAYSYVAVFQREYNEKEGELNWKIVDFMLNGAIAYL